MALYLEHFGLSETPFRITPHTDFFFEGAERGATLEALAYAVLHDEGIVKVSGEVGSGKTMLCRVLMERLPPEVETVFLANPTYSRTEILHAISEELGRPASADSVVTVASLIPQGTMRSYQDRSQSQFRAKPCMVTPRDTRMPIAPTLRSGPPAEPRNHTPLRPSTRSVRTPNSAHARISASSTART